MAARSKARKRALDVLFEADQRGSSPCRRSSRTGCGSPGPTTGSRRSASTRCELVEGVRGSTRDRIDELHRDLRGGLDARPDAGRRPQLLRLGAYELLWVDDVPDAVVINEAVELAKELSTDDSPAFVNGLLARLKELKPNLRRD